MVNWILLKEGPLKHIFTIIGGILARDTCVSRSPPGVWESTPSAVASFWIHPLCCHHAPMSFSHAEHFTSSPCLKPNSWSFLDLQVQPKIISMGHEFLPNGLLPIPLQSSPGPGHHLILSLSQATCSFHLHNFACTVSSGTLLRGL